LTINHHPSLHHQNNLIIMFVSYYSILTFTIGLLLLLHVSQSYRFADHVNVNDNDNDNDEEAVQAQGEQTTSRADVPPPSCSTWPSTDDILNRYWSANDGFRKEDGHHLTYGEVTTLGVRQLAQEMGISTRQHNNQSQSESESQSESVIFYDLGSGVGRLVAQMYLDHPTIIVKAVGVELSQERHEIAVEALSRISTSIFENDDVKNHSIEFANADALDYDIADATHIFISSLCFPRSVLDAFQVVFRSSSLSTMQMQMMMPDLQVVAALNRLDQLEQDANWQSSVAHVQMSWGAGLARIYKRSKLQ
jgi:SAM-dependent methyltransferase